MLRAVVARDGPDPGLRLGSSPLLFGSTLNATARPQSCARTLAEQLWMPALAMNAADASICIFLQISFPFRQICNYNVYETIRPTV